MHNRAPVLLLLLCLHVGVLAQGNATNASNPCTTAIQAVQYAAKLTAAARNVTLPASLTASATASALPNPTPELLAAFGNASAAVQQITNSRTTNQLNVFPAGSPFAGWGNRAVQSALGQLLYVPAATVGEVAYTANTLQQRFPVGSRADFANVSDAWFTEWNSLANRLRAAAVNETDDTARRSMLLRAVVYAYTASLSRVPGPEQVQQYQQAVKDFEEAAPLFGAYEFEMFNYTYSNGTASQTFDGFVAIPPVGGGDKPPLMVIFGNLYNWKHITFLRYGLGALRRGYAVALFDMPGQVPYVGESPFLRAELDNTEVATDVLNALQANPVIAESVDFNKTVFVGTGVNGYPTTRACASFGDDIAACVLSPATISAANNTVRLVGSLLASNMFVLANSSAGAALLPPDLLAAYRNPAAGIAAPLLLQCAPDSGATQAVAALLEARGYDPELGLAVATQTDQLAFPATLADVNNAILNAFAYVARRGGPVNVTNIAAPVLVLASAEDANFGGQEADFFAALPAAVRDKSKLVTFAPNSGAASTLQLGSGVTYDAEVFPWLQGALGL